MQSVDLSSLREPCSCGHEHKLEVREIFIGHDALKEVGPMLHDGILADVAPTMLTLAGMDIPADMTGKCLLDQ